MHRILLRTALFSTALLTGSLLFGQGKPGNLYYPTHTEMVQSYKRAADLDSALKRLPATGAIMPNWNLGGKSFWYKSPMKNREYQFYLVDAGKSMKEKAFDHARMADALSKVTAQKQTANKLPIREMV
jgi:hypothetical protein